MLPNDQKQHVSNQQQFNTSTPQAFFSSKKASETTDEKIDKIVNSLVNKQQQLTMLSGPSDKTSKSKYNKNKSNPESGVTKIKQTSDDLIDMIRQVTHHTPSKTGYVSRQAKAQHIAVVLETLNILNNLPESFLACHLIHGLSSIGHYQNARQIYQLYEAFVPKLNIYINQTMLKEAQKHNQTQDIQILQQLDTQLRNEGYVFKDMRRLKDLDQDQSDKTMKPEIS